MLNDAFEESAFRLSKRRSCIVSRGIRRGRRGCADVVLLFGLDGESGAEYIFGVVDRLNFDVCHS